MATKQEGRKAWARKARSKNSAGARELLLEGEAVSRSAGRNMRILATILSDASIERKDNDLNRRDRITFGEGTSCPVSSDDLLELVEEAEEEVFAFRELNDDVIESLTPERELRRAVESEE